MENKRYTNYRFIIQGIWILITLIQYYLPFAAAPLLTEIMGTFSLDYVLGGYLITIVAVCGGLSMYASNIIIQRLGVKKGILCALCAFVLGDFITVTAASYPILMFGRCLIGIGYGLTAAFNGALTVAWFPPKEQAFINTLNTVMGTLGQTLAYSVTIPLFYMTGSWRSLFMYAGIFTVIVLILWTVLGKNPKIEDSSASSQESNTISESNGMKQALAHREIRILIFVCISLFLSYTAFATYLPAFLTETRGIDAAAASNLASIMTIAGLVGSLAVGSLCGITGKRKPFMWPMIALMMLGVIGVLFVNNIFALSVSIFLIGFGCNAYLPPMYTFIMDLKDANPAMVASSMALTIGTANIFNVFNPMIFSSMMPITGMRGAFGIYAAILFAGAVASLLLPETGNGKIK